MLGGRAAEAVGPGRVSSERAFLQRAEVSIIIPIVWERPAFEEERGSFVE